VFRGSKTLPYDNIETVIGGQAIIKGELRSGGSVRVDGEIEGRLEVKGDLIVGDKGKIRGDVAVVNVLVAGRVEGNITAQGRIEITPTGKVKGDIKSKTFIVEEGGTFNGHCMMDAVEAESRSDEKAKASRAGA